MRCSPRWGVAVMVLAGLTPGCGGDASPPASAPVEAVVPEDPAAEIARLKAVGGDDAGALYQAGIELARRSEPAAAAQKLEAARDLAPGNSIIQRSLWVVYGTLGRPDDALAALENAVRLDPKNLDASLDLVAEHVRRSHLDKARAVLDGLEKTYPDSAAVIAARGAVARRAGDADGAREAFNRALSIDAREPEALFGLGVLARQAARRPRRRSASRPPCRSTRTTSAP
ncbi:MAG: tetratricopeptide repeat protein [Acidobacteriota bacterium]